MDAYPCAGGWRRPFVRQPEVSLGAGGGAS